MMVRWWSLGFFRGLSAPPGANVRNFTSRRRRNVLVLWLSQFGKVRFGF